MIRWKYRSPLAVILILCSLSTGCGGDREGDTEAEVKGGAVGGILAKHAGELPTKIEGAHFVEEQTGDGVLGPSDFRSFSAFTVPVEDLGKWTKLLGALEPTNDPPIFATPEAKVDWWVSEKRFPHLNFFSGKKLTGRINGWAGVDHESGEIFVFSFTM